MNKQEKLTEATMLALQGKLCESKKNTLTISDINEMLANELDTEYREALAKAEVECGFLDDFPADMYYGTDDQKAELKRVENKSLTEGEVKQLIEYIDEEMKDDYQYNDFREIADKILAQ